MLLVILFPFFPIYRPGTRPVRDTSLAEVSVKAGEAAAHEEMVK